MKLYNYSLGAVLSTCTDSLILVIAQVWTRNENILLMQISPKNFEKRIMQIKTEGNQPKYKSHQHWSNKKKCEKIKIKIILQVEFHQGVKQSANLNNTGIFLSLVDYWLSA